MDMTVSWCLIRIVTKLQIFTAVSSFKELYFCMQKILHVHGNC
jgi:hypothetical protein